MSPVVCPQRPALPAPTGPTPLDPRLLQQVAGGAPSKPAAGPSPDGWRWA